MQKSDQNNVSSPEMTYVYSVQNPAYPPAPYSQNAGYMPYPPPYSDQNPALLGGHTMGGPPYNDQNPALMGGHTMGGPPYNDQNPALMGGPAYNVYPPHSDHPHQAFLGDKPDVEVPPEYTVGLQDSNPFSERTIRRAFIRKVYITLTIQLVITFGIVFMFTFWQTLRNWVQDYPYILYAFIPSTLILVIVFACCDKARRKVPLNYILLGLFTILEGGLLGTLAAFFDADAVMWATGATIVVSLGLTLFALQTKWDFTILSGGLMVALMVLFSFGMLAAIFRTYWLSILYACIGTLIFGMYLVFDTQLILGGKHRYTVSPEDYIFATLNIYVDIVNLFVLLLTIFGLCR